MAGHNKWSKIKRKKGVEDAKRSKIFSKILKEISVAVKEGGTDPDSNPRLRTALLNGKGVNLPKDNADRAIKKASEAGGEAFTEVTYEGYGLGGVAVFVECMTDNINRTVSNVRHRFSKMGGNLATTGSVAFQFERKGIFTLPKKKDMDEDLLMLELIDAGAEDAEVDEDIFTVTTSMEDFGKMQKKIEEMGLELENASLQRLPINTIEIDTDTASKVLKMVDFIEDDEDVQAVYHNLEITDELEDFLS
jgi:YebC/PmpR family DNA-binding regulatory protein